MRTSAEQDTVLLSRLPVAEPGELLELRGSDAPSDIERSALAAFKGAAPRWTAVAPGTCHFMGGVSDYCGGLVLSVPVKGQICAAVERRTDGRLVIAYHRGDSSNGRVPLELDLARVLSERNGTARAPDTFENDSDDSLVIETILGTLVEIQSRFSGVSLLGGFSIGLISRFDMVCDAGRSAAMACSLASALTGAMNIEADWAQIASLCQAVENRHLHFPVGMADSACSLMARTGEISLLHCESSTFGPAVRLPAEIALVVLDSGVLLSDREDKFARARAATFMGRLLIDRIMKYEGHSESVWDGHVARLTVADYVDRVRDRLPTKMKGRDFLDRFGETGDPWTRIDPQDVYKVRSRTEHHIYERVRCHEFMDSLARAVRKGDPQGFVDAGEAMYASHWSYGQRCGLGSIATDNLVTAIRKAGVANGFYGAKITGRGGGGAVAVLMRRDARTQEALDLIMQEYENRGGHPAMILDGTTNGALVSGVRSW